MKSRTKLNTGSQCGSESTSRVNGFPFMYLVLCGIGGDRDLEERILTEGGGRKGAIAGTISMLLIYGKEGILLSFGGDFP